MAVIGTAVLQIIPSLDGVSKSIDSQLGGTLQASGKRGGKALAKGVGEGLKDLEREVEDAAKAYGKLKDKASDALGKVRTDEAALQRLRATGASDDRIIRAEERLATSRRNSVRANRDAEDSHRSLLNAQKSLGDSSDDTGRKMSGLANVAGIAGTALAGAGAIAGGAALAGIAALGAGVVVAGRELYDLGASFDDVFDNLRLKTGATGPALQELENATKRIATTVPASIGDIGDVVAETSRAFKGLSGADFDNLTSHLANLNRLTGENVNVRNLGKAYRIMGVEVADQVPTLDAFFRASESSGIGVNELIGVVNRGGAQLKQFGLNMASSAALVSSFEAAGVDASKVIPALNTALKGFAKAGTDPRKGLEDTITQVKALADAGNETGALDLANKVFGAKGGVAFAEVIKSGNLDLQDLQATLDSTGDTIDQAAADTDDWAERWQTFKNTVSVAVQPLASGAFDAVNGQLTGLADWVTAHQPEIIGFFTKVGEVAVSMAEFVIKSVGMVSEGVGELLAPLTGVLSALLKGAAAFERIGGFTDIADKLDGAADSVSGFSQGLVDFGEKAKNVSLSGLYDDIKQAGENAQAAAQLTSDLGGKIALLPDQKTIVLTAPTDDVLNGIDKTKYAIEQIPGTKDFRVIPKTEEATSAVDAWIAQQTGKTATLAVGADLAPASGDVKRWGDQLALGSGITIPVHAGPAPGAPLSVGPGHAGGGLVTGPGTGTSDSIPAWLSNREYVVNADATRKNLPLLEAINSNKLPGFAGGGLVAPDVAAAKALVGTAYSQANRTDCSGMVARVIARALGLPESGLMSTKNAAQWLAAAGFKPGTGGPGQISVGWYDHGPGPNDGHMALTLSDGENAEAGGKNGVFTVGPQASGANSPQFDQHMFLPTLFGEGQGGGLTGGGYGSGGYAGAAPSSAGIGPNGEAGTYSAPDAKSVREADEKVADADARVKEAEAKQKELKADAAESQKLSAQADVDKAKREAADARADLAEVQKGKFTPGSSDSGSGSGGGSGSKFSLSSSFSGFGSALGEFAGGQIGSALGVLGIPDSPPFLQAASQLIGGISVGGGSGSASPLSASPNISGAPTDAAGNILHGTMAGQAPGPQTVYNIQTAQIPDAFNEAQRRENVRNAARLDRY